ncbi:hypothetical protein FPZ12_027600 [Amycolatopsis acidicola]|uniref:Putative T7SS secretion signal domain-containing protein n=1 Tax=Amycolatopsis acidicola TaxID=2596893 RepID=A0A5N0UUT2_9PSEU|nr:hypothetical protein [Amycolatopsis acidicola]KAA9156455.1 hypothetical protein FPZ12_027600 [Amycolatopsis acidicola]
MAELGDTQDPKQLVPGTPEAIEENARVLRARADRAGRAGEGLQAIDTGAWDGPAAKAFHDKFSYEPGKWLTASDALQAAAGTLEDYATTLRWAQSQATEAIAQWNQGQSATQQATAEHNQAAAQAAAQNQPPPAFSDPGEANRQAARDTLDRARTQLAYVGDSTANALRDQATPAPQESSWLDDLGNFVVDAGTHLVNGLASFGNAMINHPLDVLTAAAGAGLTVISAAGEGLGVALDATGIGAAAGVPINAISAAGMATGATMATGAVADMAMHASGDDHVSPIESSASSSDDVQELSASQQRSVRSLQRNIEEHEDKLSKYRENPDAYDNQGILKNAPTPEIRQRIIDGRIRHLETEISTFKQQINDILGGRG